jgi:hypothetical protein
VHVRLLELARVRHRRVGSPPRVSDPPVERQRVCSRHAAHAWYGAQAFGELTDDPRLHVGPSGPPAQGEEREQPFRIVTGIDVLQRDETPQHEAAPDQQHERERNLRGHDRVADPAAASETAGSPGRTKDVGEVGPRRP